MPTDTVNWTLEDERAYLAYLKQHFAEGGDGASFKMPTFNAAAVELEKIRTKGGKKVGKSCQNKWNLVRHTFFSCLEPHLYYFKLRRTFRAIQAIKSMSGWVWSDARGADIHPEMEAEWAKFIKVHKEAKPFKNRGWVHLEVMTEIMPATLRGTYVFRPSQGISGMNLSGGTAPNLGDSESEDFEDTQVLAGDVPTDQDEDNIEVRSIVLYFVLSYP